jgi:hypothetical protein
LNRYLGTQYRPTNNNNNNKIIVTTLPLALHGTEDYFKTIFANSVEISQRTGFMDITKLSVLMLFRELFDLFSETSHYTHKHTVGRFDLLMVK